MVDGVSVLAPVDVVRLMFEARAAGDVRGVMTLMDPEVSFAREAPEGARIEVEAHRIEDDGPDHVRVQGRIRLITAGALTDSPSDWRLTVEGGRVVDIATVGAATRRLRHVA